MTETIRSILEDVDPHNPLLLIQPPTVVLPNVERRQQQADLDGTPAIQEQQPKKKRKKKRNTNTSTVRNSPITGSEVDNMLMEIYKGNK